MAVQNDVHASSLSTSSALSEYYVPNLILPREVIHVLNEANIRFMLVGAHGLGGWTTKPRATEDVDILVGMRSHKKAVRALLRAYPNLQAEDHEVVTRLRDPDTGKVVIDVMKANQPLYREALRYSQVVESEDQSYQIPSLELALAMKFSAMISLSRDDVDKIQDYHDFAAIVRNNTDIEMNKLHVLGQLVYNGGGDEITEKVRQVRAGEQIKL
jgi:hypothetical protein